MLVDYLSQKNYQQLLQIVNKLFHSKIFEASERNNTLVYSFYYDNEEDDCVIVLDQKYHMIYLYRTLEQFNAVYNTINGCLYYPKANDYNGYAIFLEGDDTLPLNHDYLEEIYPEELQYKKKRYCVKLISTFEEENIISNKEAIYLKKRLKELDEVYHYCAKEKMVAKTDAQVLVKYQNNTGIVQLESLEVIPINQKVNKTLQLSKKVQTQFSMIPWETGRMKISAYVFRDIKERVNEDILREKRLMMIYLIDEQLHSDYILFTTTVEKQIEEYTNNLLKLLYRNKLYKQIYTDNVSIINILGSYLKDSLLYLNNVVMDDCIDFIFKKNLKDKKSIEEYMNNFLSNNQEYDFDLTIEPINSFISKYEDEEQMPIVKKEDSNFVC